MDQHNHTVLERMKNSIVRWIQDPFGRRALVQKHDPVIREMHEIKALVKTKNTKYGADPALAAANSRYVRRLVRSKQRHPLERALLGNQKEGRHHELEKI